MAGRLDDGFSTTIAFSLAPSAGTQIYEKEVTPPGLDAGGGIDTTTMQNTTFRTMAGRKLITLSEMSLTVAYETITYDEFILMIGKNQTITITFPDGSTLDFFGLINEFTPGALVEGEQPTADITIIPTNVDLAGAESAPNHTP